MIQIVSIPHNGTQFLSNLLQENGIQPDAVVHITKSQMAEIYNYPNIIIPLRHPRDVAKSWAKREKDYGWDYMYGKLPTIKGHLFFLDDRELALNRLSKHLQRKLKTDWAPMNHSTEEGSPIVSEEQIKLAEIIYNHLKAA